MPPEVEFATKPGLARRMLERAFAAAVPAAWVTGDEVYGDDGDLRRWLEDAGHAYVLAVSCHHPVWQAGTKRGRIGSSPPCLRRRGPPSRPARGARASGSTTRRASGCPTRGTRARRGGCWRAAA